MERSRDCLGDRSLLPFIVLICWTMFKSIGLYPRVDYGLGKKNAQNGTVRNSDGASAHTGCRGPGLRGTYSRDTSIESGAGPSPSSIARNGHHPDNKRL